MKTLVIERGPLSFILGKKDHGSHLKLLDTSGKLFGRKLCITAFVVDVPPTLYVRRDGEPYENTATTALPVFCLNHLMVSKEPSLRRRKQMRLKR